MLVACARGDHAALRSRERLPRETASGAARAVAAIGVGSSRPSASSISSSKRATLLRLTPQLIVEAQHLGDEPWPEPERQVGHDDRRVSRGRLHQGVPLEGRQPARRLGEPRVQIVVELIARDEPTGAGSGRATRRGRARGRHDHSRGGCAAGSQGDDGVTEH